MSDEHTDLWSHSVNFFLIFMYCVIKPGDREMKGSTALHSCGISTNFKLKKTFLSGKRRHLNIKY